MTSSTKSEKLYEYHNGLYKGSLKDGERYGFGIFEYYDGSYFEGYWIDDMANGTGKMVFKDGEVYEGDYKDDK